MVKVVERTDKEREQIKNYKTLIDYINKETDYKLIKCGWSLSILDGDNTVCFIDTNFNMINLNLPDYFDNIFTIAQKCEEIFGGEFKLKTDYD